MPNDSILTVWSVDGNIEYGSVKHLILVVFSCMWCPGRWTGLSCFSIVCSSAREIQSQVYPTTQVESCGKVQATVGCLWRTLQRQVSFLDRSDSNGATDCHCDSLLHFRRIGSCQCLHYHYTVIVGILTLWFFACGVYKSICLSGLDVLYLLYVLTQLTIRS